MATATSFQSLSAEDRKRVLAYLRPDSWADQLELKVDGRPFNLEGREYVKQVIRDESDLIVIPKAAQMAFTITFLVRTIHWITEHKWHHLYLLPLKTGTTAFVQGRIDPIIDANPTIKDLFQRTDNRMHKQTVNNVNLYIRGTNIATELREIPVDVEVWDERDKMIEENLPEAEARMDGSKIKRKVELSTPTVQGHGVDSDDAWGISDQHRWHIPCPHCNRFQVLNFLENVKLSDRAEDSVLECVYCHKVISDDQRAQANALGYWEATNLDASVRGYHISQLNSSTQLLERFLDNYFKGQTDVKRLRAFYNNQLGEPYTAPGDRITPELLDNSIMRGHTLGGIPGGTVFVGVDVGSVLHCKSSWVDRHGRRIAWGFNIFSNWGELDRFLSSLTSFICVVDAHPEKEKANDLAKKWNGRVFLGFEQDRPNQAEIALFSPVKYGDAGKVTIDRTMAFDATIGSYMKGNTILPINARELGENLPRLPYNGFYNHMIQQARVEEEDANGRIIARWRKNKNADHWHHADMFEFIATLKGTNLVITNEVQEMMKKAGGLM